MAGDDVKWHGNAGEVRQGSEAKGNAGRVEVRQAGSVALRTDMVRRVRHDEEKRHGRCGMERKDGSGGVECGRVEAGVEWRVRSGSFGNGTAGTESRGTERIGLMGHGNAGTV